MGWRRDAKAKRSKRRERKLHEKHLRGLRKLGRVEHHLRVLAAA
jgi:hypothetical protein